MKDIPLAWTTNNATWIGRDIPSSASSNNVIKGLPLDGHLVILVPIIYQMILY